MFRIEEHAHAGRAGAEKEDAGTCVPFKMTEEV